MTPMGTPRTRFKTPEGRYRLETEKSHPSGILSYSSQRATMVSIAHVNDRGGDRVCLLIVNTGELLVFYNYAQLDAPPLRQYTPSCGPPTCHAFNHHSKGHGGDFLIGFASGEVQCISLRQQLKEVSKKLSGAATFNKDGDVDSSRVTALAWLPGSENTFLVAHASGHLYIYDKSVSKESPMEASTTSPPKDVDAIIVTPAKNTKTNPVSRWYICSGPITDVAFNQDGKRLCTVGRDGYVRVLDYATQSLVCGCKSYFGALLCCAWSPDGRYVVTGGEDDLVSVWDVRRDASIVAWGEGHLSWVTKVAVDPWVTGESAGGGGYRIGSVGQDLQLLLWDFNLEAMAMPRRHLPSPALSPAPLPGPSLPKPASKPSPLKQLRQLNHGTPSSPVRNANPRHGAREVVLQPSPHRDQAPRISPTMAHQVHSEPMTHIVFTERAIVTACEGGQVKVWRRPSQAGDEAQQQMEELDARDREASTHDSLSLDE
eukprot:jgi/Mesvir1/10318/Mv06180-RA.1